MGSRDSGWGEFSDLYSSDLEVSSRLQTIEDTLSSFTCGRDNGYEFTHLGYNLNNSSSPEVDKHVSKYFTCNSCFLVYRADEDNGVQISGVGDLSIDLLTRLIIPEKISQVDFGNVVSLLRKRDLSDTEILDFVTPYVSLK